VLGRGRGKSVSTLESFLDSGKEGGHVRDKLICETKLAGVKERFILPMVREVKEY